MTSINDQLNKKLGIREKQIDEHRFVISLLPCGPAADTFVDILEILGPSIGIMIDKIRNSEIIIPEEDSSFTEVFSIFSSRLANGQHKEIVNTILKDCEIDGEKFDQNQHLKGEFSTYIKLVKFALEENFSGFFTDWLGMLGFSIPSMKELQELMAKKTKEPEVPSQESQQEE